jgi:hypothetical protein
MKYLLLLYGDESRWADQTPEEAQAEMGRWAAFGTEVTKAGAFIAGEGLDPTSSATTVRQRGGDDFLLTDGPFAETREQLGGFYLLECRDLDEALSWAKKIPDLGEGGGVEVRPVMNYEALGYDAPAHEAAQQ